MGSGVRRLTDHEDDAVWDVADGRGRILARSLSVAQIRARAVAGLLPGAAFVARHGAYRPIAHVVEVGRTMWWVTRGTKVVGPVEIERIARGIAAGVVPLDTLACRASDKKWRRLDEIPELARFVAERRFDEEVTGRIEVDWASSW